MTVARPIRADRLRATESFFGPNRSERPSDLHGSALECPFCPGNEALTGALLTPDPGVNWSSRVFANIYPAVVEPDGRHEVIVELRAHDAVWTALEPPAIERIFGVYREREATGYADGYAFVALFKNSGPGSGASLAHPHSQVVALRAVPLSISTRLERLTPDCSVCAALAAGDGRIVAQNSEFFAYVPDASRMSFEVRIAPRRHAGSFARSEARKLAHLAAVARDALRRLAATLGEGFPFNMIVQSAPHDARASALMHWEIELVPRTENVGGFELGFGGFLVSRVPQAAAAILRAAGAPIDA